MTQKPVDFNAITRIRTPTESYVRYYPEIVRLGNIQLEKQLWFSSEMKMELDKMQLKYELTDEQRHAVLTVLKLFLQYELIVGEEFWMGKMVKTFPRPEVKLAASILGMTELAIHAEFYDQINIQLGLSTDDYYTEYVDNPVLKQRMDWLEAVLSGDDDVLSCIVFSMTETALLFSAFSILKSFQSNGYNKLPVTVRGTNQSAVDEDLHGEVSAEIINTYYRELGSSLLEDTNRYSQVLQAVVYAYAHECEVIDMAIPGDSLNGVPKQHYKEFVKSRLNIFLNRLGCPDYFVVGDCSILEWFTNNTNSYKNPDFFTPGVGSEYTSAGWDMASFLEAGLAIVKENKNK